MKIKRNVEEVLKTAGITINGTSRFDPQVYDDSLWGNVLQGGLIALGEGYMDRLWDVEDVADFVYRLQKANVNWEKLLSAGLLLFVLKSRLLNLQKGSRAYKVGQEHYDLGNDLYQLMLDKRMVYTSAYWKDAQNLDEAQVAKFELICQKLDLKAGQRILDIGCGWGGFMKYASETYGVSCVGISVSKEQTALAKEVCAGLPITFEVIDYQKYQPEQKFDHIVSIEMFEAVGRKNFRTYMKKVNEWLKDDGVFLLQTILSTSKAPGADPWIDKYIFPNGELPNRRMLEKSIQGIFSIGDWHAFGADYDKTLMAWWSNFEAGYDSLDKNKYNERFYRMWKYYLQICAGGFRSGYTDVAQIALTKNGVTFKRTNIR
jgi:cyclopropane-fatty-acyl-phospholipid synthase